MGKKHYRLRKETRKKAAVAVAALLSVNAAMMQVHSADELIGRAMLPAATFAEGPTSGQQLGGAPINGQSVPFIKNSRFKVFRGGIRRQGAFLGDVGQRFRRHLDDQ